MNSYVIGISGGSGSGKTSIIRELRKQISGDILTIVSQDDYYQPRQNQKTDDKGIKNFDLPTSIDQESFAEDVKLLISGHTIERKEYVFNNELATASTLVFRPAPVLVVEGLFIGSNETVMNLLDIKVFVDAKENIKVIRRIKRDRVERNYPLEDVLYRYEHHVMPSYEKYILPYKDQADIVINNNESYTKGLEILKAFILAKYEEQGQN